MGKRAGRGAGPAGKKAKGDGDNWVNRVVKALEKLSSIIDRALGTRIETMMASKTLTKGLQRRG